MGDTSKNRSRTVGSYEAKTHLPQLLDMVEEGQTVYITRRSREVARLIPAEGEGAPPRLFEQIRSLRSQLSQSGSGKESARRLVDEGRRI
jgi:prevent-host-death family protein